jgi:hypothetical protein
MQRCVVLDHDSKADGKLLEGDEGAANFWRGDFGIVHGDNHRQRTDAHST